MSTRQIGIAWGAVAIALYFAGGDCPAEQPDNGSLGAFLAEIAGTQQMLKLPVRVVDADGEPLANAKITPWALRSSQGHGWWREDDKRAGVRPKPVLTDADGNASILYPYYRDVQERTRTISVSLKVDHPDFAIVDDLHIDVPLETSGPHVIKLAPASRSICGPLSTASSSNPRICSHSGPTAAPGNPDRHRGGSPMACCGFPPCGRGRTACCW